MIRKYVESLCGRLTGQQSDEKGKANADGRKKCSAVFFCSHHKDGKDELGGAECLDEDASRE